MDKLTRFCKACDEEKEIVSFTKDNQGQVIKMSCGHSDIIDVITETAHVTERIEDAVQRDGKTVERGVSKPSTGIITKSPCRDHLNLDWKTRTKYHKVEELQDDGTWKVIHEHTEPFKAKKPK